MKKVLVLVSMLMLMILISCELKQESTDDGTVTPTEETIIISTPASGTELVAAESYEIQWNSDVTQNVNIQYTTNNGSSWINIISNIENTGSYIWDPVPNTPSAQCRIKIFTLDSTVTALSTGFFSILEPAQKSLKVDAPDGGEVLIVDEEFDIKWTSVSIRDVKIQFSTDNGSTWNSIVESFPADSGIYNWNPIPNSTSIQCLVKISDIKSDTLSDVSDATFAISVPKNISVVAPNGGESWTGNTNQTIRWYSSEVENVKIEYTLDNGVSWNIIVASTPSDGFYTWDPIPNSPSSNAKIRVTNIADGGFPSDESDGVFNIEPEVFITVMEPNGDEEWLSGSGHYIKWNTSKPDAGSQSLSVPVNPGSDKASRLIKLNDERTIKSKSNIAAGYSVNSSSSQGTGKIKSVSDVKIEYSTNNGGSWYTIVESTPNIGYYLWNPLPVHNSVLCVVRVSDAADGVPFDLSDNSFTISQYPSLQLVVETPNGGEEWNSGTTQTIKWTSTGITSVAIDYSTNNGVSWITIEENIPSSGYYTWNQVPNTASNNCKVRIRNVDNSGVPFDESNGTFAILPEPGITVKTPNGGEILQTGTSNNVTWTSENIQDVKVELTTNNGASWSVIEATTPSDGNYTWTTIPDINSSLCKIRVSDASDGIPSDISDQVFTITNQIEQTVEVQIPNGGEAWQAGTTQEITWQHTGIQNVKIELTTNNGISWSTVVASTPSDGYYTWTQIPLTASTNCKIKISDADDSMPSDDSDEFFTISPEPGITVISPNGGESFLTGTATTIRWTSVNIDNVKIEYTTNGGASWAIISSETPSDGAFSWENIPDLNSLLCQVRISDADDYAPLDISDSYFEITNQVEQTINVLAPNGGELYEAGTTRNITWSGSGVSKVSVEFTNNNGLSWQSIATNIDNTGAIEWSIPITLNSPQCKIRVKDADDDVPTDESDGTFTVKPAQSITIISPVGGEIYDAGEAITIQWNATGIENVGIRYTTTNGLGSFDEPSFYTLTSSTPNTGELLTSFSVPSNLYYIEIYDAYDDAPRARSIGNFTILPQQTPSITVISPNGGEALLQDETHNILWNSKAVENVAIEVSTNGGATWTSITTSTPSDGNYNWDVSTVLNLTSKSDNCLLRISDANSVSIFDESDGYFTVQPAVKYVNLISPNGGEEWDYDEGHMLVWESAGITFVNIYFSYDNGVTWQKVANNVPNTGGYEWDPPNVDVSLGRIKIEDATDATISDISDGTFKLDNLETVFRPFVYIVQPIGSSVLTAGTVFDITWNNSEDIVSVDIEYSADNGQTWANVVLGYTQTAWDQLNTFSWNVPATTTTGRIRITGYDVNGGQVIQTITDPFTIQ